ncbi:MAG: sigma-70 family RNA polymerase sigma factor [Phycisphaerae bacterium]|nr:sigma-70 family RNA polymerase sigma factor [Phycisphaerae bacterium]
MSASGQTELWITAAAAGDQLALAKLLATYHPILVARVNTRLDPSIRARLSPEDVLQEFYLQLFQRVARFEQRGPASFLNWVLTILDHKLVDLYRSAHRAQRDVAREAAPGIGDQSGSYGTLLDQIYRDSTTPSRIVRHDEAVAALMTCVSQLPEAYRRVIELRFLDGRPLTEVAERLGKSEDAVVALTQRALKALRDALDARGEHTAV